MESQTRSLWREDKRITLEHVDTLTQSSKSRLAHPESAASCRTKIRIHIFTIGRANSTLMPPYISARNWRGLISATHFVPAAAASLGHISLHHSVRELDEKADGPFRFTRLSSLIGRGRALLILQLIPSWFHTAPLSSPQQDR